MISLVVLRHAPTTWTAERRLQGRADPPLSDAGRARVALWRLDPALRQRRWYTSPLRRAAETAALLRLTALADPALVEMDWGAWEGARLEELRAGDPEGMAKNEARGLDLLPPGGESPRAVQQRLAPFLAALAGAGRDAGAVCHKGVIRALFALATGWDMRGKPPQRIPDECLHFFRVAPGGALALERPPLPLTS